MKNVFRVLSIAALIAVVGFSFIACDNDDDGNGGDNKTTTYAVTVNGGSGSGNYAAGATVSISATVPSGQTFVNWTINSGGANLANANSASTSFTMPANAVTITANFSSGGGSTYAVTVNGGSGSGSYAAGATVSISATVPSGQTFVNWTVNSGGANLANANSASTSFTMPANAVTVTANFLSVSGGGTDGETTSSSGIVMVSILGGTFIMGSPATEPNRNSDETQHPVTLSGFSMSKNLVTQAQWVAVMGAGEDRTTTSYGKGDNYPIYYVNWYDAIVFCNKLSVMEGLDPVYSIGGSTDPANWGAIPTSSNSTWNSAVMDKSKNGYRLPTEAEWEYACRAGTTTPFNTGNNITTDQANYNGNYPYNGNATGIYRGKATPVGSFAPNAWGLYDMHGNLYEWCWDWYGSYASGAQTDPTGAATGTNRVTRGVSWYFDGMFLRSAFRGDYDPSNRVVDFGFRLVRS